MCASPAADPALGARHLDDVEEQALRELLQHRVKHEQRILPTIPLVLRTLKREEQVLVLLQVLQAGSILVDEVVLLGGLLLLAGLCLRNLSLRGRSSNLRWLSSTSLLMSEARFGRSQASRRLRKKSTSGTLN